jgi:drug/metabolite transporter (DMT)-like permease
VAALLFAAVSWAAGTMRAGSWHDPSPERRAATQLVAGGTLLLTASVLTGEAAGFDAHGSSTRSLLALAYLTVFGTLVAYRAFVWLLSRTDPASVASHAYVNPAVAVVLGATVGGEVLTPSTMIGAGVIVLSVIILLSSRPREQLRGDVCHGREPSAGPAQFPDATSRAGPLMTRPGFAPVTDPS